MTVSTQDAERIAANWGANLEALIAELRASETRYANLIHSSPDGVLVLDKQGAVLFANPAAAAMFGYAAETLVGHIFGFPLVHNEATEVDLVTARGAAVAEMRVAETTWQGKAAYLAMLRDVTERRRLENAVRESQARLHAVIENAKGLIWSFDGEMRLLVANTAFLRDMQRHFGRAMLPGDPLLNAVFAPQVNDFWRGLYQRVLAGESITLEVASELQHPGGVVECSLSPIRAENGVVTGGVGVSRDITERRQLEAAVRTSEARLRYALEATSDGVWDWDIPSGAVVGSDRWFELFGYAPGEAPSTVKLWEDTLHPEDAAATLRALSDYLEGRAPAYRSEHRVIVKSGEVRWHLSVGKVVARDADGKPVRMVGTNADITERKLAEQQLRDSEERLRLVMQNSPDVIAVWDERGRLEYLSPALDLAAGVLQADSARTEGMLALATTTGCDGGRPAPEELAALGMDLLGTENWLKMRDAICYAANHPGDKVRVEYRQQLESGEFRDLEAVYQGFVRSAAGREVVSITRDITEHKTLQRLLHQANADLEERVAARTVELEATVAELHRANTAKDAFMAAISHELRTPLTGVLGMSELLQSQARGPLNADQERYVTLIRESGERLLETVNSVLRYTSLVAQSAPPPRELCRLLDLCASAVRAVQAKARHRRQHITIDVEPSQLTIFTNADNLTNLVAVLLDNAVKFTPDEGALGVEARCVAGDTVRLVVWDTGIGIPKDQLAFLFQPFTQADQGLARQFSGIGLGLAYVHRAVELLGGAIEVQSEPNRGSRIIVTLPASEEREHR